ncbi:Subtilisin-chymotrypsin inhibitor-2A [Triticum urartu]|uniref:Subtilisin-chymotrypsin inhibitor-2A n=1 Tax=Triticum urartu TaxID=4572 RepID=M7YL98_TRIUA|nr:subtilisin-chymotrypsin inhibitor-2A-like [Triticum urartu]EMS48067.1 Subtilisin-chymotrypsin inhibitor-2A [Triticum urartu]
MSSTEVPVGTGDLTGESWQKSWPEVVGKSIKGVTEIILKDKPDADIVVLPAGSPVTRDLKPNRVRIFVDTVADTPFTG